MRQFVRHLHRALLVPVLIAVAAVVAAAARNDVETEQAQYSTVAVARAESIMVTGRPFTPAWLYPEGRIDYGVIEWLLNKAVAASMGFANDDDAWDALLNPSDRVGIQVDVEGIQPHDPLLEALVRGIMDRGVPMRNIIIFAGEESALFRAGYDISGSAPGVQVMASDDRGYRKGLTRIVLDYCTRIINISRLRVDPHIGMYGALANALAVVPYVERQRLTRDPRLLPEVAAKATIRRMTVLHVIDALSPAFRVGEGGRGYDTWAYNGVLASTDPVAIDAVGREILQEKLAEETGGASCPEIDVPYLAPAAEVYRLGTADLEQINVVHIGPRE